MEQVRSFIAIELPEELKLELTRLVERLKSGRQPGVKWVDPSGIHLTLKFLGNIAADRIDEITSAMEKAAAGIPPFQLEVEGLGVFPNLRRVQVAWVGLRGEIDKAGQLQRHLESNLSVLGFAPEPRAFTPHLTLARLRNQASLDERQTVGQLIANTNFKASSPIKVSEVSLMRSQLTREGAVYSQISSVELRGDVS